MQPLISVIIPAYNAEKYISKCIESIQNNTYKNLEIIIVNDGSKDNTRQVVESFSDSRIKLINQENGGVSKARNTGLDNATGEYIAFIDSDDYIREDYFERMITPCLTEGAEISCCVYQMVDPMGIRLRDSRKRFYEAFIITPQQIADTYFDCLDMGFVNFVFRVYNRKLVGDTRFSETLKWGEDGSFNLALFRKATKVYVSPEELYFYVIHPNQATARKMKNYTYMMIQHIGDIDDYIAAYEGYRIQSVQQGMGKTCLGVLVECAFHSDSMKTYKQEFRDFKGQSWCSYLSDPGALPFKWRVIHKQVMKNHHRMVYLITKLHRFLLKIKHKLKAVF
jgi:glycosyltransferase involved in cell wall biosynthesis